MQQLLWQHPCWQAAADREVHPPRQQRLRPQRPPRQRRRRPRAAEAAADTTAAPAAAENPVAGKKVAYIMLLPSATIFQMWKDSCASLCEALDVKFDFFFCDGDFNKWQDTIRTCASAGYDGLLVSHGNQDGSYVFLKEITEQYPDMKIVTFDTQFYSDGEYQKLPGRYPDVPAG